MNRGINHPNFLQIFTFISKRAIVTRKQFCNLASQLRDGKHDRIISACGSCSEVIKSYETDANFKPKAYWSWSLFRFSSRSTTHSLCVDFCRVSKFSDTARVFGAKTALSASSFAPNLLWKVWKEKTSPDSLGSSEGDR